MLGTTEIIIIVIALFVLFGASRLPKLAKSLGESRKAFKQGMEEAELEFAKEKEDKKELSASASTLSDEELAAEMQRRANQS